MKAILILLITYFSFSSANAGWESFLTGVLEAKTKQMEEERKENQIREEAGINKKELDNLLSKMKTFIDCINIVEYNISYEIIVNKSPTDLSYSDFRDSSFASSDEVKAISWYADECESCYSQSLIEYSDPESFVAYELLALINSHYVMTLINLAKLNNQKIDWGEFNINRYELLESFTEDLNTLQTTVENRIEKSVNKMILADHKKIIRRQAQEISRMVDDRSYFNSKIRKLEIEMDMIR